MQRMPSERLPYGLRASLLGCGPGGGEGEGSCMRLFLCATGSVEDCVPMQETAWRAESVILQGIRAKTVQLCEVKYQIINLSACSDYSR